MDFDKAARSWASVDPKDITTLGVAPQPLSPDAVAAMLERRGARIERSSQERSTFLKCNFNAMKFWVTLQADKPNAVILGADWRVSWRSPDEMNARCQRLNMQQMFTKLLWRAEEQDLHVTIEFLARSVEDVEWSLIPYLEAIKDHAAVALG